MGDSLEGTGFGRRSFLLGSSLAVVGAAGCLETDPTAEEFDGGDGGGNGGGDDGDPDATVSGTEAPEPDFTVGDSDDADYETVQQAYDALESGDVIGLEPGTHTLQPDVDNARAGDGEDLTKTYTYVGDPDEETTLEFVTPEARSFVVRGPQRFKPEDGPPGFWHLTLDVPEDVTFARIDDDELDEYDGEYDGDADSYSEAQSDVNFCTVHGSLDGPVSATESVFYDALAHELSPRDCHFMGTVRGSRITARRCQFDGQLRSDNGWVTDSVIEGTANLNNVTLIRCDLDGGLNVTGHGRVENCVIEPQPDSRQAISISSSYRVDITDSVIHGTVRSNQDGSYIDKFELNVFDVPSSTRWIIDGAPATDIYLNAFVGGDVRITTDSGDLSSFPADDLTLYDRERELGNYYSEWDGEEAADGILKARTLPGDDGEMDRYPLAHDDLESYVEDEDDD
ncbi:hypothetical protein [Natrarchaeobaculum aegyptiacum]|uniref:Right handed beta helix domain-containing protein n=1 Tax=Natrarchaeobaculum aegyptiacum TaxID=745377 RepID=A0A2Z2I0P3_9EURY|nr:hypothetical protein [Natrarchaeobaculum aegyptiacum]ARS91164.1 hypothetical protein B1756_16475 [Natrarchaeobaculum aegyptiacum]